MDSTLTAKLVTESNEAYHANPAIGRSMLWDFRKRRALFYKKYIAKTIAREGQTASMRLGSMVHTLFLEPEKFKSQHVRVPDEFVTESGALSKSKKAVALAEDMAELGMAPYTGEEYTKAEIMTLAITLEIGDLRKHECLIEQSIQWEDELSGLTCKCRPDWLIFAGSTAIVPDIKTTQDISEHAFFGSAAEYGYHLQHVHYTAGILANFPQIENVEFMFVAVESNEPFECKVYRLVPEQVELANKQRTRLLMELAECMKTGDWRMPTAKKINPMKLKPYAFE